MSFAVIRDCSTGVISGLLEIITITPDPGVPGRPTPGPTPPDPNAPHPEHPIYLPGMPGWGEEPWRPRPTHPIVLPGDPSWGTGTPPRGLPVVMYPLPTGVTPPPTPAGLPTGTTPVFVTYPGEKVAALAWVQPYPSTGPVTPPTTGETPTPTGPPPA